ncbi:MAG: hypothetical protein ACRDNW_10395 [Trebonia sp.]
MKVIDPVAVGQSVADFRHLSEYDSRLMDEKTWTSERDIERVLDELSDHLEVVHLDIPAGPVRHDRRLQPARRGGGAAVSRARRVDYPNGFTTAPSASSSASSRTGLAAASTRSWTTT